MVDVVEVIEGLADNKLSCRLDNLLPGTVVQFNVIATNQVGDSKPSDTSALYYVVGKININVGDTLHRMRAVDDIKGLLYGII